MHFPEPPGCSSGMQRMVALVSSLIFASHSLLPHHQEKANPFLPVFLNCCTAPVRKYWLCGRPERGRRAIFEFLPIVALLRRPTLAVARRTCPLCRDGRGEPAPRTLWPRPSDQSPCAEELRAFPNR